MTQQQKTVRVYTTGPLYGKNVVLGGRKFVNGVATVSGTQEQLAPVLRKLARGWQAYPEGSAELKAMLGDTDGKRGQVQAASEQGSAESFRGDGESRKQGAGSESEQVGGEHVERDERASGVLSSGNGHLDSGIPEQHSGGSAEEQPDPEDSVNPQLARVVYNLDPDNDSHWTQTGKPALNAITEGYGAGDVTRSDVNRSAPGWNREKARQAALSNL